MIDAGFRRDDSSNLPAMTLIGLWHDRVSLRHRVEVIHSWFVQENRIIGVPN